MNLPTRNSRLRLSQGQIFWREVGEGVTLVFLHGSWQDGDQWMPVVDQLGVGYHCLVPDLIGFGESERPRIHYSIALEVESLAEFLEALKLKQVYLIGHSLGGWVATSYALKYPERVLGLALMAPEGLEARSHRKRWQGAQLLRFPAVYWMLRSLQSLSRLLKLRQVDRLLQRRQTFLQTPVACQLLFGRRWAEINAELLQNQLAWLKVPVLLLQGEANQQDDHPLSPSNAQGMPQAKRVQLAATANDLPQTRSEEVSQAIREFVSGVPIRL